MKMETFFKKKKYKLFLLNLLKNLKKDTFNKVSMKIKGKTKNVSLSLKGKETLFIIFFFYYLLFQRHHNHIFFSNISI
jgi:hypothetical protein